MREKGNAPFGLFKKWNFFQKQVSLTANGNIRVPLSRTHTFWAPIYIRMFPQRLHHDDDPEQHHQDRRPLRDRSGILM